MRLPAWVLWLFGVRPRVTAEIEQMSKEQLEQSRQRFREAVDDPAARDEAIVNILRKLPEQARK